MPVEADFQRDLVRRGLHQGDDLAHLQGARPDFYPGLPLKEFLRAEVQFLGQHFRQV